MTGNFVVTMPYADYLAANWLMIRTNWLWRGVVRYLMAVGSVIFAINFAIDFAENSLSDIHIFADIFAGLAFALAALTITFGWWLWCIPRSARKAYSQLQMDGLGTKYVFNEGGIQIENSLGTSNLEWRHFTKWCENDRLLLLFRTNLMFFCIPKAQLDGKTINALREVLITASIPTR